MNTEARAVWEETPSSRARHVAEAAVPAPLSKHRVLVHLVRDLVEEAEVNERAND